MDYNRKTVGYVKSLKKSIPGYEMQTMLIRKYSQSAGIVISEMFADVGFISSRHLEDYERAGKLGIKKIARTRCFPAWEEILLQRN